MKMCDELSSLIGWLRPIAIFVGAMLAMLGAMRLGLVVWQIDRVSAANMLGEVFLQGLRFDLVLVGALLMPVALVMPLFFTSAALLRVGKPLLLVYWVACFAGAVFMVTSGAGNYIIAANPRVQELEGKIRELEDQRTFMQRRLEDVATRSEQMARRFEELVGRFEAVTRAQVGVAEAKPTPASPAD